MNQVYNAESAAKREQEIARLNNAGCVARKSGLLDVAYDLLRKALDMAPHNSVLNDNFGTVLFDMGDAKSALIRHWRAAAVDRNNSRAYENYLFVQQYVENDPIKIRHDAEWFDFEFCRGFEWPRHKNFAVPERRLRVGYVYVGGEHCQDRFLGVIGAHTYAIQAYKYPLSVCGQTTDQELASRIEADEIDVLVDCTMHMAGSRPLLWARKPAPVQIAWLAYPGTTGMRAMDYRISDWQMDPAGSDGCYTEKTLRVPNFWCGYDPASSVAIGLQPSSQHGCVTLGCLSNPGKITDDTLKLWAPIFKALPHAALVLPGRGQRAEAQMQTRLRQFGIEPANLRFFPFMRRDVYLNSWNWLDIALDTIPAGAHTTMLDALWMGVPMVSRVGSTAVGRGGASILGNLRRPWAVHSDAEFVEAVVTLAGDHEYRARERAALREDMQSSVLMDFKAGAKSLEDAYRIAWREWCADPARHDSGPSLRIDAGEG
jgi:hypothetical protein